MQLLRVVFNDGVKVDIDILEFGEDEGGAIIDRLAKNHKGVRTIERSTTMLPPIGVKENR